jgi:hypothetical protein
VPSTVCSIAYGSTRTNPYMLSFTKCPRTPQITKDVDPNLTVAVASGPETGVWSCAWASAGPGLNAAAKPANAPPLAAIASIFLRLVFGRIGLLA